MDASFQQKIALKNEAKDMILKGCYKMAMNKYRRLIKMGSNGFNQRQWAIIHLNLAISYQFQDKLQEALESVNQSIKIDPQYEKAYYRKLQILSEEGKYEEAISNTIPIFITNPQIHQLKDKITEQYQKSLGLSQLRKKLNSEQSQKFITQTHRLIFQRIKENHQDPQLKNQINQHYLFLRQKNIGLASFINQLLFFVKNSTLLDQFWPSFLKNIQSLHPCQQRLIGHLPAAKVNLKKFFTVLNYLLKAYNEQTVSKYLITNRQFLPQSDYVSQNIENIIEIYGEMLGETLQKQQIKNYIKKSLLMDIMLNIYNLKQHSLSISSFTGSYQYKYKKIHHKTSAQEDNQFIEHIKYNLDFKHLYLVESVINYLEKDKDILYESIMELISSTNDRVKIMLLMVIGLCINPLKSIETPSIQYYLSYCQQNPQLKEITLKFILLACLNKPQQLKILLLHRSKFKTLLDALLKEDQFVQETMVISNSVKLLYLCVENLQQKQELLFAQKMGVSVEEIHKARKLQGETMNEQLKENIQKMRKNMKQDIAKNWTDILKIMVEKVLKFKEKNICGQMSTILKLLSEVEPYLFYHTSIIQFMLSCFNQHKMVVGQFFINISKKCNPQIFKYVHLQPICNCLMWVVAHGDHQLSIFQALLSLVNLSSQKMEISLSDVLSCLYQQNQYIIHGALELINNILINQQVQEKKRKQTTDVVKKYYGFYRETIQNGVDEDNLNDYAHPYKVYCTLLSVLMVLQEEAPQFQEWKEAKKTLSLLKGELGITIFKLAMHHYQRLPKDWFKGLQEQIENLKSTDRQKWIKLHKMMI